MNDLERYFYNNPGRVIHKWTHYFEVYERHFARYRNRPVSIVEIGVYRGGSLQMWKHYFGSQSRIHGVDIDPNCAAFAEDQVSIAIGDQADRTFLRSLAEQISTIDILIDDGGHTMAQQIATFEELFPRVAPDGVYLCEDLHTSYWPEYGGGYRSPDSFIEYSKHFIDYIHAWHAREPVKQDVKPGRWFERAESSLPQPMLAETEFTRSAHSLHFYDSILVIEKRPMARPTELVTGGGR